MRGVEMTEANHRNYHESRALEELRLADEATDPAVANLHRELAALHKRKLLSIVEGQAPVPPNPSPPYDPQI